MKDSGSREPLILSPLFYLSSFLTKMKPPLQSKCSGGFYVIHYVLPIFSGLSIFDFHNHFQTIDQFTGFQFVPVNNGNSKLRGTVPGCCVAPFG